MDLSSDFAPSGFFVLRTPLLPFDDLVGWVDGVDPDEEDARAVLRSRLRDLVGRPHVREAIVVASPAVDELIPTWIADPDSERGRQCERALVRYVSRMAGRSTPFGLFAGVSAGTLGTETSLSLAPRTLYRRRTRLDAGYLVDVVDRLLAEPDRREGVTYRPNPSLYRCGGRRRYFRSRPAADEERHRLISVRESPALEAALDAASGGATPPEVRARLAAAGHDDETGVVRFVDELIEQQVLVPDLGLAVTGSDASFGLASSVPALAAVAGHLAELDGLELGEQRQSYRRLEGALAELDVPVKPGAVFQVDMTKELTAATLGEDVAGELLRGVDLRRRLTPSTRPPALLRFVERLQERHEGEPVPLLEALDPDLGVGFGDEEAAPSPLLADIGARRAPRDRRDEWGPRESHLLDRMLDALARGARELVLDAADVEKLSVEDSPPLPDAFAAFGVVAASSDAALAGGRFRVLVLGADGPSGARLLGRFCHADADLRAAVERHLRAEEALDPDAVFAEIVHLPRARDVNVVARPVLREYEIPCITGSGVPRERQIALSDLLVAAEDGRATLYSARLGRRVVPRLTCAHNFGARGMSAYRFLCALQDQREREERGFWGPLDRSPFLPRVRSGRVVLAAARWRLEAAQLDHGGLQEWRRASNLPRFVALGDYGGQTPVDLDNALAIDSLEQIVRSRGSVTLVELFPPPDELCVDGPEGRFVHELVVPFVRGRPATLSLPDPPAAQRAQRRFPPGGEWLYVRLYTGETLADDLLRDGVSPLVREAVDAEQADRWFFLRYRDPEFHLRLRLHGDPAALNEAVRPAVERLAVEGVVWRTELGTYQREVGRYGGPEAIEAAEAIFYADSEAVLAILPLLEPGEAGLEERWRLGLAGAHRLLLDLGLTEAERLDLVSRQRDGLARDLRWDRETLGRVGARFRRERMSLAGLLDAAPEDGHPLEPGLEILRRRSVRLAPAAEHLQQLEREGRLARGRAELAASVLHMHLNRLLRGDNSAQELVICDFLKRLYEARAPRVSRR